MNFGNIQLQLKLLDVTKAYQIIHHAVFLMIRMMLFHSGTWYMVVSWCNQYTSPVGG